MKNNINKTKNPIAFVIRRVPHYRLSFYKAFVKHNKHLDIKVFYGMPEDKLGGSGLLLNSDYPFLNKVTALKIGAFVFQIGLIGRGIITKYKIVVFEGSLNIVSSLFILLIRRIIGKKNIIWLKGWPEDTRISKIKFIIKKLYLSLANAYIVYGNESKNLLKIYNIPKNKITVTQNTVDLEDILSKKYLNAYKTLDNKQIKSIIISETPYIYNIGRIVAKKRVEDLVETSQKINSDFDKKIQLVIAGNGPQLDKLKKKAQKDKIKNIHFLGTISDEEAKTLYANCLFCVFPGAVGLSLNEAMAAGKAVICANEKGPDSELLIHNYNGIRYEKGNIEQLTVSIKYLLNNKAIRENLGQKAFESILQRATLEKLVDKITSAIDKLLTQ